MEVWHPHLDANQRDEVVEALMGMGWDLEQVAINGKHTARIHNEDNECVAREILETPGLAVCRAALKMISLDSKPETG